MEAYAVAFHGHPRYTKDLDIWIDRTLDNATHMVQALEQFGFGSLGVPTGDFLVPEQILQMGYPPHRIDLLTSLEQMDFQACYQARVVVTISEVSINFIDLFHLKKSKQIAGRHQDLADLEHLP